MDVNREEILANFQACTDVEDVGEAILLLEGANWDLLAAIKKYMPENTQQLPSEMNRDVEMLEEIQHFPRASSGPEITCLTQGPKDLQSERSEIIAGSSYGRMHFLKQLAGSSRAKDCARMIKFQIHYLNQNIELEMPDQATVCDLKIAIQKETKLSPCQQILHGWRTEPQCDSIQLRSLQLPRENTLHMTALNVQLGDSVSDLVTVSDRLTQTYTLNIKDEANDKTYSLKFPGTHTIVDVKCNVYTLTDIPARNQVWKGWPPSLTDDNVTLAASGIDYPECNLTLNKTPVKEKKEVVDLVDSDSSVDEQEDGDDFEDVPGSFQVDDDIFTDNIRPTKTLYLMPDNVEDETIGTLHFAQEYEKRYEEARPQFFTGTLEDAIAESCLKPAKERKLLAVYLHHENSILSNVFCTQLLGCETVLQLLSANFVIWGWDCTYESNKQRFINSVQQTLGPITAMTVRSIDVDTMPVLMIIMRSRSTTEVYSIIYGNVSVTELLTNLMEAVEIFQGQRNTDIGFEEERQAREKVKEEQDKAYQESLALDRAKEEAKVQQEKIEKQRKEEAQKERLADEARKEAHRQAAKSSLPPEPQITDDGILKIRVRLPAGKVLERRFHGDTPLQTLLNFLIVEGYPMDEYRILSSWPRKDLTLLNAKLTLNELHFCAQETVILEER